MAMLFHLSQGKPFKTPCEFISNKKLSSRRPDTQIVSCRGMNRPIAWCNGKCCQCLSISEYRRRKAHVSPDV